MTPSILKNDAVNHQWKDSCEGNIKKLIYDVYIRDRTSSLFQYERGAFFGGVHSVTRNFVYLTGHNPESIIIVMLELGSLSLCCCDGNVELGPGIA